MKFKPKKEISKQQFEKKVSDLLNVRETLLLNFNIYFNPDHIEYYTSYHAGKYRKCLRYLSENKHLLTLEHTPEQFKENAVASLKMFGNEFDLESKASKYGL
jgi:hypothetical protein